MSADETLVIVDILHDTTPKEERPMAIDAGMLSHFDARLVADRDRHSSNATSFEKILEIQYAGSQSFRDSNAARIVMEAGSGRTRAETNGPGKTAADDGAK